MMKHLKAAEGQPIWENRELGYGSCTCKASFSKGLELLINSFGS